MAQVVNNDKLTFVITSYGLGRIAEALQDSSVSISLSKIKIGDANGSYYEPLESATSLLHPIEGGEFFLSEKELLEDELTVSLLAVIPENSGGYDIREVGVYETVNGEDFLFALGTQQPIVKPSVDDNYLITVDYYIFLKSQNLADVYEQIVLNPETQLVTDKELSELMRTVLFSQTNLMDQIGHNSFSIGLNRAAQLQERIETDKRYMSGFSSYSNYLDLYEMVSNSIFGYWVFDYPKKATEALAIVDYSEKGNNLTLNKAVNLFEKKFEGFASTLKIADSDSYSLSVDAPLSFLNESGTSDTDFTMFFCLEPLSDSDRTLLARSNYASGINVFEIKELANRSLYVRLFYNSTNYITFTSGANSIPEGFHVLVLSYTGSTHSLSAFVDGIGLTLVKETTGTYPHMNPAVSNIYGYSVIPTEIIYTNTSVDPTALYNEDGTPYTEDMWTLENGTVLFEGNISEREDSADLELPTLFGWTHSGETVYTSSISITSTTVLYNSDRSTYIGTAFEVTESSGSYSITYNGYPTTQLGSIPSTTIYAWKYTGSKQVIWADKSENPTMLLFQNGDPYTGSSWALLNGVVYFGQYVATRDSEYDNEVPFVNTTSYVISSSNTQIDPINSRVALISVIKDGMSESNVRAFSLLLLSTLGKNPCVLLT